MDKIIKDFHAIKWFTKMVSITWEQEPLWPDFNHLVLVGLNERE